MIKLVRISTNALLLVGIINLAPATGEIIFQHDFDDEALHTYTQTDLEETWNSDKNNGSDRIGTGAVEIVQDPDPSGTHGKVMRVFHAANNIQTRNNSGSGWRTKIGSHDELYFAYDLYFEDDAEFVLGGKLPGLGIPDYFSAAGVHPDGTDRWTGGMMWHENGIISNYVYHANQPRNNGQNFWWWGPNGKLSFKKGKWNRIEIYYKMNTPGVLDGRLKGWLDGELAFDTAKIMFRMPGGEHLTIGSLVMNNYYGGGDLRWAPTTDQYIYFDNFIVSSHPLHRAITRE